LTGQCHNDEGDNREPKAIPVSANDLRADRSHTFLKDDVVLRVPAGRFDRRRGGAAVIAQFSRRDESYAMI
jgi:hypothetical protein